jgi:SAM-dependent methyltransferase
LTKKIIQYQPAIYPEIKTLAAWVGEYLRFYETPFGGNVLRREAEYIRNWLGGCRKILDVGCGPGVFERELSDLNIVGVDSNPEMINAARALSKTEFKVAQAEHLPFQHSSFDGVFFTSSLAFIDDYVKAIDEAARVLVPDGRVAALLCNTESAYFKDKLERGEYTSKNIKHTDMKPILDHLSTKFNISGEYMLGVRDGRIVDTSDAKLASIYAVKGTVKRRSRVK